VRILTGRSRRLLPRVIREVGEAYRAGGRCLLLVPEQYTLQAELELVRRLELPGFFDLEVLSPTRLTHRVFERAGNPPRVRIDARGKRMVLRCALEEMEKMGEELRFYRRAASRAGFVDKAIELIADLKRSGVSPEALRALCAPLGESDPLRAKLEDVASLYAAYQRRMAGRFVDGEDVESAMRDRLAASGLLQGARVWVCGFDMLTESFARTLTAVARVAESLCVALVMDQGPGEGAEPVRDAALYAPVARSVARWERMLAEGGLSFARDREEAPLPAAPALAHLESELYAYPVQKWDGELGEALTLRACATPFAEACKAAEQILTWVREEGLAWHEIAVQYTDAGAYAGLIRQVFSRYGIPAYIDEKAAAGRHPLIVGLLAALRCATQGYAHEDAMLYLKSGFCGLTDEEGFLLERYAVEHGLRGARWKQPLTRGGDAWIQKAEPLRARFAAPLAAFQNDLRAARDADGTLRAVVAFLRRIEALQALEAYGARLEAAGFAAESAHNAQIWAHLMEVLDQMHALLDGRRGTSDAVVDMLSSGLADAELGALPPSPQAVPCGALGHMRTGRVRALLVLGLGDGKLGGDQPGLLADAERARAEGLAPKQMFLGLDAAARAQLKRLDVLQALTLPEERLWLSYPLADMAGAAQRPATVCAQLKRIFPKLEARGDLQEGEGAFCASPRAALDALGPALREAFDGAAMPQGRAMEAYAWLRSRPEWRGETNALAAGLEARVETDATWTAQVAQTMRETQHGNVQCTVYSVQGGEGALLAGEEQGELGTAAAKKERALPAAASISRLETYAACPYRYFVDYVLKPRPIEPYGIDRGKLGTWYHDAMEAYTRQAMKLPGWPHISRERSDALMEEVMGPLMEDWRFGPLGEDAQGRATGARACATARRAAWTATLQLQGGGFMPEADMLEFDFGQGAVPGIALPLKGGGELVLRGRIDRVDTWREGGAEYLRVVDYKSGKGEQELDGARLYEGLQQQLPLYLAAALGARPGAEPAGMFYFRIDDPLIDLRPEPQADAPELEEIRRTLFENRVEERIGRKLRMNGVMLGDPEVARALGSGDQITKEGAIDKRAVSATTGQMRRLLRHAKQKAAGFAQRIAGGDIGVRPVQLGEWCACQYCEYASLCGIDPLLEGGRPRAIPKLKMGELHERLEKMEGEN